MNRRAVIIAGAAGAAALTSAGRSPGALITRIQHMGNLSVAIVPIDQACGSSISGTFSLPGLGPPGTTVFDAFILSGDFLGPSGGGGALSASLNSMPIGTLSPFDQNPTLFPTSFAYLWGASSVVTTGGNYAFNAAAPIAGTPGNQICGAALVVITQNAAFPMRTITINAGATVVGDTSTTETETTTFSEMIPNSIGAGQGFLWLYTLADDVFSTGESASFNGGALPLLQPNFMDANLGFNSSLGTTPVTTLAGGMNQASLTTNGDFFAWDLAILVSPVPAPGAGGLLLAGVALAASRRRRG